MEHINRNESPAQIKHVKISGGKDGQFFFSVAFTKKCKCDREPRIKVAYNISLDNNESTTPAEIKKKTITTLKKHKRQAGEGGLDLCGLDLESPNEWLHSIFPWKVLFLSAQLEIAHAQILSQQRSINQQNQHREKRMKRVSKDWFRGPPIDKNRQSKAKFAVRTLLENKSEKNATVATSIVSSIANELGKCHAFNKHELVPHSIMKRLEVMEKMMDRASSAISHMRKRMDKNTNRVLTAVAALFVPEEDGSRSMSCSILKLNRQAKYVDRGLDNRELLEKSMAMKGNIMIGELVHCIDGYGTLHAKDDLSGKVSICLHPYNTIIEYRSIGYAKMARWYPSLDTNVRAERSDKTPQEYIDTIQAFHQSHNCVSPNKKDVMMIRHPIFRKQYETKIKIYRYESWDELWVAFQKYSPGIAARIVNKSNPSKAPTMLSKFAPPELVKGKDASCLCINCEGTNQIKRGGRTAGDILKKILANVTVPPTATDTTFTVDVALAVVAAATGANATIDDDGGTDEDEEEAKSEDDEEDAQDDHANTGPLEQAHIDALATLNTELLLQNQNNIDSNAVRKLRGILKVIQQDSKYDMCCAALPCLDGKPLESAKYSCINCDCPTCGFDKLWSKGVKASLFKYEYDATQSKWVGQLNDTSPVKSNLWNKQVDWREYCYKTRPSVAAHAQQVARATDADDDEYTPTETAAARNLILETRRGTIVDYLDAMEQKLTAQIDHRNLVSTEYRSKTDYYRNSRPGAVARDIDFSENGSIEDFDKVQSQHWNTHQYTLFISICSWLLSEDWNEVTGKLSVGDAVTVYGELAGENINMDSFWAAVKEDIGNDSYVVKDANGNEFEQKREDLRFRNRYSVAFGHITDDKKHDRWAMQHFTSHEIPYLEKFIHEKFPQDIPGGKIKHLHQHSDNATSHFKNVGAMHYFTSLTKDLDGASFLYNFGAPGHGKGPFDGIGGAFKNLIHRLIQSTKTGTNGVYGVASGYIVDVVDVFDALVGHYSKKSDWSDQRVKNPINHYKFFLYTHAKSHPADNGPVPRAEETFHPLVHITKNYQFQVTNVGNVCTRARSCFCLPCMSAIMKGSTTWQDDHQIPGCTSSAGEITDIYNWKKRSCTKLTGRDVVQLQAESSQNNKDMAESLSPGDFVVYDASSHDEVQPFWLGRVMANDDWDGKCTWTNDTRGTRTIGDIEIGRNEVAMNILWYERRGEGRVYNFPEDNIRPIVQCNRYLIMAGIKPTQIHGQYNRVQMPRRRVASSAGEYARPQLDLQERESGWYRRETNCVYEISEVHYNDALSKLGLWVR